MRGGGRLDIVADFDGHLTFGFQDIPAAQGE